MFKSNEINVRSFNNAWMYFKFQIAARQNARDIYANKTCKCLREIECYMHVS